MNLLKTVHVWIAAFGSLVLMSRSSAGQSIVTFQNEVVTRGGGAVPGIPGAFFSNAIFTDPPALQDDGKVLFQAQFAGAGVQASITDHALFHGDKSNLTKILRWGDPEPTGTIPGATINQILPNYALSASGSMVFSARVAGPGITFSNDSVLYAGTPGNLQLVAREGDPAPDCPPGTVFPQDFTAFGLAPYTEMINASGHVAFAATLSGTLTGAAVFAGAPGSLVRVMTMNEIVGPNLTVNLVPDLVQINASGQVLLERVSYLGGPGITTDNNTSVWIYTPGAGKQQILREGDPSPIPGAKYIDAIDSGTSDKCNFNANGQTFMRCGLTPIGTSTAVTPGVDDIVLMLISASGHTVVARKGGPAPGIPGATLLLGGSILRLNDSGVVSFCSEIAGPGVTPANDTALWVGTPGNLVVAAREGDVAPGTGGVTFGDMCGARYMNGASQVVFSNFLNNTPVPQASLWCWDPVAGLQAVTLSSDFVEVSPANTQPVGSCTLLPQSDGDSRPACFADDGTLAMRAGFGILKTRMGSLTGSPKAISATAGGVHSLFLNATVAHAGQTCVVAGSVSGTSPGIQAGPFLVPLNPDFYTDMILMGENVPPFGNTLGTLSPIGRSVATITIPPGIQGISGIVLHHVFGAVNGSGVLTFVSEPASLTIVP